MTLRMKMAGAFWAGLLAVGLFIPDMGLGGTWAPLARTAPGSVQLMLLLPDGTVMAANNDGVTYGNAWYRLTPDTNGRYANGTWTKLASMQDTRLYYASQVLRDGRVLVAGGEYGTGTAKSEVYNPLNNTWTSVPVPTALLDPAKNSPVYSIAQGFYDAGSKTLPNGTVLVAPVGPGTYGGTMIFDPASNIWSAGPTLFRGGDQDEASWVKLPDDSILSIDPFGVNSERYIPSLNQWINDATVPVSLYNSLSELGPAFLLPDGRAFFLGGTGHTAFYTPSGSTSPGTWAAGPDIPNGLGVTDGAGAMMFNGKILCVAGSPSTYNPPASFFEYDPVANTFTSVSGPTGPTDNVGPFETIMLDLPDGNILYSHFGPQLYVYHPDGSPLAAAKPGIVSVTPNADGSFHLAGTLLNGISEGAAYGDDAQMESDYPLVRLADSAGNVYYGRTYNWNSSSVMTGGGIATTEFVLPATLPLGSYSLSVVVNGVSSDPIPFPIVQNGSFETGDFSGWAQSGNFTFCSVDTNSLYARAGRYGAKMGPMDSLGYISQSVATTPGSLYLLSFWLDSPTGLGPNEFSARWNGGTVFDQVNVSAIGWTNLRFLVTATTSNTIVQFGFRDDQGYLGFDDVTLVPVSAPEFLGINSAGGVSDLTWTTEPGLRYQLQFKNDLSTSSWTNLGAAFIATNSTATVPDSATDPTRFYRVVLSP